MKVFTLKFPPVEGASHYEVVYTVNGTSVTLNPLVPEIPNLEAEEGTPISGSVAPVINGKAGTPVLYSFALGESVALIEGPVSIEITGNVPASDPV